MPRPPRADEAGGLYHALNRGNSRTEIFHKAGDFEAFERILGEGLELYDIHWFAWRWVQSTEPIPRLLAPWPIPRLPHWIDRVNEPLTDEELSAIRRSAQRGSPLGNSIWIESVVKRLGLESTLRPRGRPRIRPLASSNDVPIQNKES